MWTQEIIEHLEAMFRSWGVPERLAKLDFIASFEFFAMPMIAYGWAESLGRKLLVNPNDNTGATTWISDSAARTFAVGLVSMACGNSLSLQGNVIKAIRVDSESNVTADRTSRLFTSLTARADEVEIIQLVNEIMPEYLLVEVNYVVGEALRAIVPLIAGDEGSLPTREEDYRELEEHIRKANLVNPTNLRRVNTVGEVRAVDLDLSQVAREVSLLIDHVVYSPTLGTADWIGNSTSSLKILVTGQQRDVAQVVGLNFGLCFTRSPPAASALSNGQWIEVPTYGGVYYGPVYVGVFGDGGPIAKPILWKAPEVTVGEVLGSPGLRPAPKGSRVGSVWREPDGQEAPILSTEATKVSIASSYNGRVIIHDVRKEVAGASENPSAYFAATREDAACLLGDAIHERTSAERQGWEEDSGVAPLLRRVPQLVVRRLDSRQLHAMQRDLVDAHDRCVWQRNERRWGWRWRRRRSCGDATS